MLEDVEEAVSEEDGEAEGLAVTEDVADVVSVAEEVAVGLNDDKKGQGAKKSLLEGNKSTGREELIIPAVGSTEPNKAAPFPPLIPCCTMIILLETSPEVAKYPPPPPPPPPW